MVRAKRGQSNSRRGGNRDQRNSVVYRHAAKLRNQFRPAAGRRGAIARDESQEPGGARRIGEGRRRGRAVRGAEATGDSRSGSARSLGSGPGLPANGKRAGNPRQADGVRKKSLRYFRPGSDRLGRAGDAIDQRSGENHSGANEGEPGGNPRQRQPPKRASAEELTDQTVRFARLQRWGVTPGS